jgi:flagellar basal-body rod protein FlgB
MLQPLLANSPIALLKQVARFAERRQDVLAGNVANIDTPGYRMRDLPLKEFQAALEASLSMRGSESPQRLPTGIPWTLGQPASLGNPTMTEELFPDRLFQARIAQEQPGITFQDANNRSIEHQMMELTKNSMLQNFAMQVMTAQYSQLQAAISGQV